MASLQKNKTWELVDRPIDKKIVRCRWIFAGKYKIDGMIKHFKVGLMAKGYTQIYGIDYIETFTLISKINTTINIIWVLLALGTNFDRSLQQFDVKNIFLHGKLSKEVYIRSLTKVHGNKKTKTEGLQVEEMNIWIKTVP